MKLVKRLLPLIFAGTLTLGVAGCGSRHPEYSFDGTLGEEQVIFTQKLKFLEKYKNLLIVTRPNGNVIVYSDHFEDDLQLDSVKITESGETRIYYPGNEVGDAVLEEAQKKFDAYLEQIKEANISKGLESLQ